MCSLHLFFFVENTVFVQILLDINDANSSEESDYIVDDVSRY